MYHNPVELGTLPFALDLHKANTIQNTQNQPNQCSKDNRSGVQPPGHSNGGWVYMITSVVVVLSEY